MAYTNRAAVLFKPGDLRVVDAPVPEPGPGEVQLRMRHVGICGSDISFWKKGFIGKYVVRAPLVLGHEGAGVVSKLGEGVTNLKVGDRVAIEPGVPCRKCWFCKNGRYNICPDEKYCATPPDDGNLARFYVHEADFCFKLPDHVSTEEGALVEPLAVAVHASRRAGTTLGSKVLVCGAGPIGMVNLLTAKACGAAQVCVTDIDSGRLEMAKTLGADAIINVSGMEPKDTAVKVAQVLGDMPDITIECSGAPSSIRTAIYATRSGGCVMCVGFAPGDTEIPIVDAAVREVDIRFSFRKANCYPCAIDMIASGKINVMPLITHRFDLDESVAAFETTLSGAGIKVMLTCNSD